MGMRINTEPLPGPEAVRDFEAVMAQHESALLRYATRFLNDPHAAQDVVQEAFVKLFEYWRDGARPTEQLSGWLYRVTHNAAVDHIRREDRRRRHHLRHAEENDPSATPCARSAAAATALVLEHVHKLDPTERQVLILRLQEGLPYKEIAAITGRSEGNVGCLLHHAVKNISAQMKKAGVLS